MNIDVDLILSRKPALGEPCTHCGLCCLLEQCGIGQVLFPAAEGETCKAFGRSGAPSP